MGQYRTAEVCLNGHHTTDSIERAPERRSKYCPKCGATTITQCPSCSASIRGDYDVPGVIVISGYQPPNYCYNCGTHLPWMQDKISAAQELVDEIEELSKDEQSILKRSILELAQDSPRTEVASVRYKKLIKKSGGFISQSLNSLVASIATEAAKKLLGLS